MNELAERTVFDRLAKYMSVSARLKLSAVTWTALPAGACANETKFVAASKRHAQSGKTKAFIVLPPITACLTAPIRRQLHLSKRIDIIHDRDLPQDHLADDVARPWRASVKIAAVAGSCPPAVAGGELPGRRASPAPQRAPTVTSSRRHRGAPTSEDLTRRGRPPRPSRPCPCGPGAGPELERHLDLAEYGAI